MQVREFKPSLVAIRDAAMVPELKELIKDVEPQPEIMTGEQGTIEVSFPLCKPSPSPSAAQPAD